MLGAGQDGSPQNIWDEWLLGRVERGWPARGAGPELYNTRPSGWWARSAHVMAYRFDRTVDEDPDSVFTELGSAIC
jgi:hypothetical protein